METYSVLRACQRFDLPLVALRGISDGAEELREIGDWTRYLNIVDQRLAQAVDILERAVAEGTLTTT
jgi:adenosylhomocysteine nucleosidase